MNAFFWFASIARTIGAVLATPGIGGEQVQRWAGLLGIASNLANRVDAAAHSPELQLLSEQIDEAVAAGRGLTDEQRAMWRAKSDAISAEIGSLRPGATPPA